jgi:hypothetical protein
MNTAIDFIVLSAGGLVLLSLVAGGVAIAGSILYRATMLKKQVAAEFSAHAARRSRACS